MSDISLYKDKLEKLSELAKKYNCVIITATQIAPIDKPVTVNRTINEKSGALIMDYIDLIKED